MGWRMDLSDSATRVKLAAAGVCFLLALIVGFQIGGGGSPLPDGVQFVCVETGDTFWLDRSEIACIPAQNPDTARRTLLPCIKSEDGVLRVGEHYREVLAGLAEVNAHVDTDTLGVRDEPLAK